MALTNNYATSQITESLKGFGFIEDDRPTSNRSFELNLKLSVALDQLERQAYVFASNYSTHGHITFFKAFRTRPENVFQILKELYIYSFVKALYNGIFCSEISNSSDFGLFLDGHGHFYHFLKNTVVNSNKDGIMFFADLDLGTPNKKHALILQILAKFSFLRSSGRNINMYGTKQFSIPKFEGFLNALEEDHYCKNHTQQGERKNYNEYPNGKLCLMRGKASDECDITSFMNTPIFNAFLSNDGSKLNFILPRGKNIVPNNASFFFSMSVFIARKNHQSDEKKIDRIYNQIRLDSTTDHLVCSQVHAMTGINCTVAPSPSKPKIKLPELPLAKIEEYLTKLTKDKIDEIFSTISQRIEEEIDLELLIEEFFPKSKKLK